MDPLAPPPVWLREILLLPLWLKLTWLFAVGAALGSFLNVVILRVPERQTITGRSQCRSCGAGLRWWHNLPIIGWLILRGRCASCGQRFSVRYLLVELMAGCLVAGLYWWEVDQLALYPPGLAAGRIWTIHLQWFAHTILGLFLIAAAFIDIDHYIIPDEVTVPGTLLGLTLVTISPAALLPTWTPFDVVGPLSLETTPIPEVHNSLRGGQPKALMIGLACLLGWCLALFPWRLIPWARRVRKRAGDRLARACVARHALAWDTVALYVIAAVGSLLVTLVWWWGSFAWMGLLTGLVGLAVSGGITWSIRLTGRLGLGREALGFGDVTLMAMIGATLGWQATLITLFMAAFYGLALALGRLVLGDTKIQFGPALCLGAATTVVLWHPVWQHFQGAFLILGWWLGLLLPLSLAIMLPLLIVMRFLRERISGPVE